MSTSSSFAKIPAPPYYAVIFSSQRTEGDGGYEKMAERMKASDLLVRYRNGLLDETGVINSMVAQLQQPEPLVWGRQGAALQPDQSAG